MTGDYIRGEGRGDYEKEWEAGVRYCVCVYVCARARVRTCAYLHAGEYKEQSEIIFMHYLIRLFIVVMLFYFLFVIVIMFRA